MSWNQDSSSFQVQDSYMVVCHMTVHLVTLLLTTSYWWLQCLVYNDLGMNLIFVRHINPYPCWLDYLGWMRSGRQCDRLEDHDQGFQVLPLDSKKRNQWSTLDMVVIMWLDIVYMVLLYTVCVYIIRVMFVNVKAWPCQTCFCFFFVFCLRRPCFFYYTMAVFWVFHWLAILVVRFATLALLFQSSTRW